jgi:D-alanyl-lipoteichoic acid acyltransferase DltB (MBOAT superfamily)
MLFNSWEFWIFFFTVLPLYWALRHRAQNWLLLIASYVFYGFWDWRFLWLIAFSTAMDYALGWVVASAPPELKKRYVYISVVVNLTLLGIFKYYGFFSHELSTFLTNIGLPVGLPVLKIVLPVGISFYTFQSMSYVLDISRGVTKPADNFWDFALYVCFFPHLVAGPIMRSGNLDEHTKGRGLLTQIMSPRIHRPGDFTEGLYYIVLGMFKKVVIGDNLATLANTIFQNSTNASGLECLAGLYAFAFQIYADFSGYSSIAQGVAKWMGFDLMTNFRMPYLAVSPSDFWRRWHISLSTWLRDYVYVSFGGNRRGKWMTYRNLMLTMILGGIWHGANWTFVAWGVFHGALLCAYRIVFGKEKRDTLAEYGWLHGGLRVLIMFHFICISWLLFRAESLTQASSMFMAMLTDWRMTPIARTIFGSVLFYAAPMMLFEWWVNRRKNILELTNVHWSFRAAAYTYAVLMLICFPPPVAHEFIYFQF